jgi:hypothetical protein
MDHGVSTTEISARPSLVVRFAFGIALCSLMLIHGKLTLQLFGPDKPWHQLLNDEPLTSGRHAVHLQQGALGAAAVRSVGSDRIYDPSEYAGYPRTPVFDAESRPAECIQLLVRRRFGAAAYKIGMALTYWLIPAILGGAALLWPSCRICAVMAMVIAILVAWTGPATGLLESGDWCVPLTAVVAVLGFALLAHWNNQPSVFGWCGLVLVTTLDWYIHPSICLGYLAIGLAAWAALGRRHGWWWHAATALTQVAALALSYPAWSDWLCDWWMRLPVRRVTPGMTLREIVAITLWLIALPMARVLTTALNWLLVRPIATLVVGSGVFLVIVGVSASPPGAWQGFNWGPRPLTIGLGREARTLEECVQNATSGDARVLWEDLPGRSDLGWTVLLPARIGRPFMGGLDPDGALEHAACALRAGALAGRRLSAWSDAELDGYARRYNVGCIVCSSAAACERFARWPAAVRLPIDNAIADWRIFDIRRPYSFVLKGQARQFEADVRRVTMSDVIPDAGEVVLSLHYQDGWRARPGCVRVERELDPFDPIPFIRLRMPGPVGRVTLTWGDG